MAIAAKEAALEDAQVVADILLDAEVKLGEMLEGIPNKKSGARKTGSKRGTRLLPSNIDKKQSHHAQQLSKHPDIVEEVKQTAREKGKGRYRVKMRSLILGANMALDI